MHKNVCMALNYIKHSLSLAFVITGCVSISAFASLLGITVIGIASFVVRLKTCARTARIKKYKSIIKKQEKKYDKIVLLEKTK